MMEARALVALMLVAATGALAAAPGPVLVAPATSAAGQEPPEERFEVYHFGSLAEGRAFREVFLVHDLSPGLRLNVADVEIRRNGAPLAVTWETQGEWLDVDDRFWFVQEAFDQKQTLTAHVGDAVVMECSYGGGAGIAIHPDEWRDLGLPDEVRCLQLMDDQLVH